MLSASLRRRAAPSSPDPHTGSPLAQRGRAAPFSSVSSKKSFTNLWQKRESSKSPIKENHHQDKTAIPSQNDESLDVPPNTVPASSDLPAASPSRLPKKRSRSLSRSRSFSGSTMPSKALLGKVASVLGLAGSGMTWAANKLHSQSEDHGEVDSRPTSANVEEVHEMPKTSPRKVRFASRGHRPRDLGTLPIDMPKKPVPSLPPLELPKVPIMDNLANTPNPDSIPVARLPETPVLKAQPNDGYFGLLQQNQDQDALPPPISAPKTYAIIDQSRDVVAPPAAPSSRATEVPELSKSSAESQSLITPTKEASQEDLTACPTLSEASSVVFPQVDIDLVIKASYPGRAQDQFSSEQLPSAIETHEDTRQRFRGRPVPKLDDGCASPESDSTSLESPHEVCHVFLGPSSHQQEADCLKHRRSATQYDDSSISAVRDTLDSMSLADTLKSSSTQPSAQEKSVTACDDIEVPILLTPSTTPSASPTRSRRPFRFSNTSEQKSEIESCANTGNTGKRCSTERTPSPESLPLPLSIPPKRGSKICSAALTPPPKWSPLQEDGFLYALAVATSRADGFAHIHKLLSEPGGFATLWNFLQLPEWTAPDRSVAIPSPEEISDLIKTAQAACKASVGPVDHRGWSPFDEILFPGVLVTVNNDIGTTALYQWLSSEGGFKTFWEQTCLPDHTAPSDDTRLLHEEVCQDMVKQAWRICGQSSDQHGWLPFAETNFPSALISAISAMGYDQVSSMLLQNGGFAKFWKKVMLPRNTAPRDDTRALTAEEMDNIVQKAHRMCGYKREINPEATNKLFQHAVGPVPRPSPASTVTRHRVQSDAWLRRQQQYSGEVSTIDIPLDPAEENSRHARHKNDSWSFPWCSENQSANYGGDPAGQAREQSEGAGARVRRSIGSSDQRHLTPFLMLDHFRVPQGAGFPDHPHRGQETITYLLEGSIDHEDFTGNRGTIGPGDLQFMTAGRGIMHAEMPGKISEVNVGMQLWVDLPQKLKSCEPRYRDLRAGEIPIAVDGGEKDTKDSKVEVKVISGRALGVDSLPVQLAYTPVWLLDVTLQPEYIDVGPYHCVIFRQQGDHIIAQHVEDPGTATATANEPARFILAAGQPHDQPIVQYGPFVTTSRDAVIQAMHDFHNHANGFERAENWQSEIGKSMM
ncbi:hypothetical protein DV738_g5106, partial [Chaetothyriales sp. CBS 135597]